MEMGMFVIKEKQVMPPVSSLAHHLHRWIQQSVSDQTDQMDVFVLAPRGTRGEDYFAHSQIFLF